MGDALAKTAEFETLLSVKLLLLRPQPRQLLDGNLSSGNFGSGYSSGGIHALCDFYTGIGFLEDARRGASNVTHPSPFYPPPSTSSTSSTFFASGAISSSCHQKQWVMWPRLVQELPKWECEETKQVSRKEAQA
ncbi:hypothetical protein A0H81_14153 [Grifola frondosa]|uniref:Uncharacterized protein n=1 Tax=Grifola frondosa TaxID=5627 RepID=A0A1C7LMV9_GRIFR|nr:hypothetical protein A0H81_14153 [Grifola frondosa]